MCSSVAPARSGAAALFGARAPTKRLAQSGAAVRSGAAAHNNQWRLSTWRLRVSEENEASLADASRARLHSRSEEHTSELQSHHDLVCRLLLEKKKGSSIVCQGELTNPNWATVPS